jgi:hypothetical protein
MSRQIVVIRKSEYIPAAIVSGVELQAQFQRGAGVPHPDFADEVERHGFCSIGHMD